MPRGFYSKEIIHPYFTTEEYKRTDQYRREVEYMQRVEDRWNHALQALKKTLRRTPKNR